METEKSPARSLHEKIVELGDQRVSDTEIAEYLKVSVAYVQDVLASRRSVMVNVAFDHPAYTPRYGSEEAAGIDLCAHAHGSLPPGARTLVRTGLSMELPRGSFGMIAPRSGLALKWGITVLNAPGIIDSDYRGDVGVILHNAGTVPFLWSAGDRVAQLVIMRYMRIEMHEVTRLGPSGRGDNGFGSTGVAG